MSLSTMKHGVNNMKIFFAMVDGRAAFYCSAIHGENIPQPAREISPERHAELLAMQGKVIVADADGQPVGVDVEIAPDQATRSLVKRAHVALDASDKTILRCLERGVPIPAEWTAYRAALRTVISKQTGDMPKRPAFPKST